MQTKVRSASPVLQAGLLGLMPLPQRVLQFNSNPNYQLLKFQLICAHIFSLFLDFSLTEAKNVRQKLEFSLLKLFFLSWNHPEQLGPCDCWPTVNQVQYLKTHLKHILAVRILMVFCLKSNLPGRTCRGEQMFTTWCSTSLSLTLSSPSSPCPWKPSGGSSLRW